MYPSLRLTTAIPFAALTTLVLFYVMRLLIETDEIIVVPSTPIVIELVKPLEMSPLVEPGRTLVKPPEPQVIPPTPKMSLAHSDLTIIHTIAPEPPPIEATGIGVIPDSQPLPIVRIEPNYPRRAQVRGVEGYTVVEFDLNEHGGVENTRIIEAYPSEIFNQASLQAIRKFRFQAKIDNGKPMRVGNLKNRFRFNLDS